MNDLRRMQLPDTPTEISDFAVVMEFLEPEEAHAAVRDQEGAKISQAPDETPALRPGRRA